jgi:hypothetical protein
VLIFTGRGGGIYMGPRRGHRLDLVGNSPSGGRPI